MPAETRRKTKRFLHKVPENCAKHVVHLNGQTGRNLNKTLTYVGISISIAIMISVAAFLFVRTETQLEQVTKSTAWHEQFHAVFDGSQAIEKLAQEIELNLLQYVHYYSEGSFQQLAGKVDQLQQKLRDFNKSIPKERDDASNAAETSIFLLSEQMAVSLPTIQPGKLGKTEVERIEAVQKSSFYTHLSDLQLSFRSYIQEKEKEGHLSNQGNNENMRENSRYLRWLTATLVIFLLAGWFSIVLLLRYRNDKERTLQEHEQTLSAYFNSVTEGILVIDPQWVIRDFNQALEKLILQSGGKLPKRSERLDKYLAPDQLIVVRACLENAARGVQTSEEVHLNFGGKSVWILLLCTPVFNAEKEISHVIISMDDVDLLIQTRSMLVEQETKFQSVISSITSGVVLINKNLEISYINPAGEELLQLRHNDLPQGRPDKIDGLKLWSDQNEPLPIHADTLANWNDHTDERGNRIIGYQRSSNHPRIWLLGNLCQMPSKSSNEPDEFLFSFSDYTYAKLAADELRETEELLKATFQSSPVPIIISKLSDGRIRNVNDHFVRLTLFEPEELIGKDVTSREHLGLVDPEQRRNMVQQLKERNFVQGFEMQLRRKDGVHIDVLVSASIITINQEAFLFSYLFDYTERKHMENELRFSEEKFYSIFHHSPVALSVVNAHGELIDVNETLVKLSGFSREDFIGKTTKNLHVYFDEHDRDRFFQDVKENGFASYREVKLRDNFGQMRFALMSARSITIKGEPCVLSFILDLSDLKHVESELKRNEQTYRSLASNVPGVVFRFHIPTNGEFYFSFISEKLGTLYGSQLSIDAGFDDVAALVPAEEREAFRMSLVEAISQRAPWVYEGRIVCGDGSTRWVAGRATPAIYEDELVYSGLLIDIHDLKEAENKLVSLNSTLLEKASELESSNQELERFAYIASHDLQEPLRMVSGFVRLLEKRYGEKLDDAAREYIHYAVDGADRMKRLIDDLLLYSRVGRNQDQEEQIRMDELVDDVGQLFPAFALQKAKLVVHELPTVWARPTQIRQLMQNLIGNALKYNDSEIPEVTIRAFSQHGWVTFSIQDNGIGIDESDHQRIFDMFTRLHSPSSQYTGSGIGLAICKKIVERHGGRIQVSSTPNQGSTFQFTLPATSASVKIL